ncbi:MAG: tail fiber domain-containing protein [Chitinophagales bacterium]
MNRILTIASFVFCITNAIGQGQFKIRNDQYIQIGYATYKALTFGQSTGSPNNGNFSIEYCSGCTATGSGGLNIWKPWPTAYAANYLMYIRDNGNIGIGNNGDASYKVNVSGSVRATSFVSTSDERLKTEIKPIDHSLDKFLSLPVYQYKYREQEPVAADSVTVNDAKQNQPFSFDDHLHMGLMAQDLEKRFPDLVITDDKGFKSINYVELVPLLIRALQEQNQKIDQLISSKK